MTRPSDDELAKNLDERITEYVEGDERKRQVAYTFYVQGQTDADGRQLYMSDTLRETWADRPPKERLAEQIARYDRWWTNTNQPLAPVVPTEQQLAEEVANAEQAMRDAQRTVLEARDRQAEHEASVQVFTAVKSGDWNDMATWETNDFEGVPGPGDKVIIPADVKVEVPADVSVIGTVQEPTPDEG